jgi:hypothetical protein
MGRGKIVAVVMGSILVLGFGVGFYQMYGATHNIKVGDADFEYTELMGINPVMLDIYPDESELSTRILIENPANYSVKIDETPYNGD